MLFASLYAFLVGIGMVAQLMASYVRKQIPELASEPSPMIYCDLLSLFDKLRLLIVRLK